MNREKLICIFYHIRELNQESVQIFFFQNHHLNHKRKFFFYHLIGWLQIHIDQGKQVYICGLDGDFERKKFGQILEIIPLCDKIYKLTSLCSICKNGNKGIFSMRLTGEKEQTVVGSDNYIPVCRECYNRNSYL